MLIDILNTTSPGKEPSELDVLLYKYSDGTVDYKIYYSPPQMQIEDYITIERNWRNKELKSTDWIVPTTDHPKHSAYMIYRQELRDYPSQENFPNGERPVKP